MDVETGLLHPAGVTKNEAETIYVERVRQLHNNATIGMVATLLNSLVTVIVLRTAVPVQSLLIWFSCLALVTTFRFFRVSSFRRITSRQDTFDARRYGRLFIAGLGVSGVVWGGAAVFLFPAGSVPHQIFLAFVVGGMVAGAAGTFSAVMGAFFAYSIPALVPLILRFLAAGDEMQVAMGLMVLLFGILLTDTARRVNRATATSLELRVKNKNQNAYRRKMEDDLRYYRHAAEQLVAARSSAGHIPNHAVQQLRNWLSELAGHDTTDVKGLLQGIAIVIAILAAQLEDAPRPAPLPESEFNVRVSRWKRALGDIFGVDFGDEEA